MCDCLLDWVTDNHVSTDSAEPNHSWESNICSANEEVPRILRIPKVHYRVHNIPPLVLYLCQMNPFHVLPLYLLKVHLILSFTLSFGLKNALFSSGFRTKSLHVPILWPIRATRSAHHTIPSLITRIIFGYKCKPYSLSLWNFLQSLVTSSLFLTIIFSSTLILHSCYLLKRKKNRNNDTKIYAEICNLIILHGKTWQVFRAETAVHSKDALVYE